VIGKFPPRHFGDIADEGDAFRCCHCQLLLISLTV
jgi:hypothetical protein